MNHDILRILSELITLLLINRMEVSKREYSLDIWNLIPLDIIPEVVAKEEQAALRVVDDVDYIIGVEVLKDRNDNCTVCDCCDVADAPASIVTADKRNLITRVDTRLLEHKVELCHLLCYLVV